MHNDASRLQQTTGGWFIAFANGSLAGTALPRGATRLI
jgi:hypothetical protein